MRDEAGDLSTAGGVDPTFKHFGLTYQEEIHGGVWANEIYEVTSSTLTFGGAGMTTTQWIKQATKRTLDDLDRMDDPTFPSSYDPAKAERVCRFIETLPHVSRKWAVQKNNTFKLERWQVWMVCSLFGFVNKETRFRRFSEAYICVARKNGKSFLMSALSLYVLCCDGEAGAQFFSILREWLTGSRRSANSSRSKAT